MHSKVKGFEAKNLKELWRWLKELGMSYSGNNKWIKREEDVSILNIYDGVGL